MIDPGFVSALSLALEKAINTTLHYDPGTNVRLKKLQGCIFQFACSSPDMDLFFSIESHSDSCKVNVSSYSEKTATTQISTSLFNALAFITTSNVENTSNFSGTGISILGNSAKLATLHTILQELEIDWEQALSDLLFPFGESAQIVNHQAANVIKTFLNWLRKSHRKFRTNFASYLQEELRIMPTQTELDEFYESLTDLRSATERAEARIQQLIRKLNTH